MGTVRDGVYYSKHKGDVIDNLLDKTVWQSNPNLLDGWYFVGGGSQQGGGQFPINQRGGYVVKPGSYYFIPGESTPQGPTTTYYTVDRWAGGIGVSNAIFSIDGIDYITDAANCAPGYVDVGYGIDRWKTGSEFDVTINTDELFINNPYDNYGGISQIIENPKIFWGKTLTFSVLGYSENGKLGTFVPYHGRVMLPTSLSLVSHTFVWGSGGETIDTELSVHLGCDGIADAAHIKAVKLELGDTQTLAHQENGVWVLNEIPNYQEQLARCQRYQYNPLANASPLYAQIGIGKVNDAKTGAFILVPTPVTMRHIPAIIMNDMYVNGFLVTLATVNSFSSNAVTIECIYGENVQDTPKTLQGYSASSMCLLDANL